MKEFNYTKIILKIIFIFSLADFSLNSIFDYQDLKIGKSDKIQINSPNCKEMTIPATYKKINIKAKQLLNNINKILITDSKILTCQENDIELCCLKNSTFCITNSNIKSDSEFSINFCVEKIYLYACGDNKSSQSGEFTVETNIINDEGCNTLEFAPLSECSSFGLDNCKDQKKCIKKCVYTDCLKEDTIKPVLSFCLQLLIDYDGYLKK